MVAICEDPAEINRSLKKEVGGGEVAELLDTVLIMDHTMRPTAEDILTKNAIMTPYSNATLEQLQRELENIGQVGTNKLTSALTIGSGRKRRKLDDQQSRDTSNTN